jgi:hypothetical protein
MKEVVRKAHYSSRIDSNEGVNGLSWIKESLPGALSYLLGKRSRATSTKRCIRPREVANRRSRKARLV